MTKIRVTKIRVSEIRVSKIRVTKIRVTKIRISSNHRVLHGAIFTKLKVRTCKTEQPLSFVLADWNNGILTLARFSTAVILYARAPIARSLPQFALKLLTDSMTSDQMLSVTDLAIGARRKRTTCLLNLRAEGCSLKGWPHRPRVNYWRASIGCLYRCFWHASIFWRVVWSGFVAFSAALHRTFCLFSAGIRFSSVLVVHLWAAYFCHSFNTHLLLCLPCSVWAFWTLLCCTQHTGITELE